jgi:predicted deacylase
MGTRTVREHILPAAFIGTERRIVSVVFGSPARGPKAYIQAGLHADEPPGLLVARRLLDLLTEADERGEITGQIVVVPVANPIGLAQWNTDTVRGRFDDCNLVNFNRSHLFLGERVGARLGGRLSSDAQENIRLIRKTCLEVLAEQNAATEAEYLKKLLLSLAIDADIVIDLHCDFEAVLHVYAGTTVWPDNTDLSIELGAAVTLLADDSGGQSFDEACGRIWLDIGKQFPDFPVPPSCFATTVELRGTADTRSELVEQDAGRLFSFLQRRGCISGDAPPLAIGPPVAMPLDGVDFVTSPATGILMYYKKTGDWVCQGDIIAEVIQPLCLTGPDHRVAIRSTIDGILFARSSDRFARPGKIVAKVAGEKPLEGKGTQLLTI